MTNPHQPELPAPAMKIAERAQEILGETPDRERIAIRLATLELSATHAASRPADGDWVMVPREKLTAIHSALSHHIGDTDPYVPDDATDDEVREDQPVFWAAQQLASLTFTPDTKSPGHALKRHPSHDWIEDGDEQP